MAPWSICLVSRHRYGDAIYVVKSPWIHGELRIRGLLYSKHVVVSDD